MLSSLATTISSLQGSQPSPLPASTWVSQAGECKRGRSGPALHLLFGGMGGGAALLSLLQVTGGRAGCEVIRTGEQSLPLTTYSTW